MPSPPPDHADPQPWRVACQHCGLNEVVYQHRDAQRLQKKHQFDGCSLAIVQPE